MAMVNFNRKKRLKTFCWGRFVSFSATLLAPLGIESFLVSRRFSKKAFSRPIRIILNEALPRFFFETEWQTIDVVIPATSKDLAVLSVSVESILKYLLNPIGKFTVVCPAKDLEIFSSALPKNICVVSEEIFLPCDILLTCHRVAPKSRLGWTIQQSIKFYSVLSTEREAVLVFDSDTVMINSQGFLGVDGTQSLSISDEYHLPYQNHFRIFMNNEGVPAFPFSFVTHHQLMKKKVVRDFLKFDVLGYEGLSEWISLFDFSNFSPACEYHSYGTFLLHNRPDQVRLVAWGNKAISRENFANNLSIESIILFLGKERNKTKTVSLHSYL
jgi:hypothetical protein